MQILVGFVSDCGGCIYNTLTITLSLSLSLSSHTHMHAHTHTYTHTHTHCAIQSSKMNANESTNEPEADCEAIHENYSMEDEFPIYINASMDNSCNQNTSNNETLCTLR